MYVVVVEGLAVTDAPIVPDRSVDGDQTYVEAPNADKVALPPEHTS